MLITFLLCCILRNCSQAVALDANHTLALLQPQALQPSSGSGGTSSAASQPFSFEALSGMAAQDRPLNSPDLGPLQVRQSSMFGCMSAP